MSDNESPRLKIPFPAENAESWYAVFADMMANVDARIFANLEHTNLIHVSLPLVEITHPAPTEYRFVPHARAVFLSRTHFVEIEVTPPLNPIVLVPGSVLGAVIQGGAVGPQSAEWEQFVTGLDVDADVVPLGHVNADYSITWFNGAVLPVATLRTLFAGSSGGGGGGVTPRGYIYVDELNGDDATGTGKVDAPFKTMPVAAASVVAPTDWDTFHNEPAFFIVAPGSYAGDFTMPFRQNLAIMGEGAIISGDILVPLDRTFYFGEDPTLYGNQPRFFVRSTTLMGISGDITWRNVNPVAGVPGTAHNFAALQVVHYGSLINDATSGVAVGATTGQLVAGLDLYVQQNGGIAGHHESYDVTRRNTIALATHNSVISRVGGHTRFARCHDSYFATLRWDIDEAGAPYNGSLGRIGDSLIADCSFGNPAGAFGWDGVTGGDPMVLHMDANSYVNFVDHSGTFDNMAAGGYYLRDRGNGVGIDSTAFEGHLLPTDADAQLVADRLDWLEGTQASETLIEYYIDPVAGDDNADGLTPATALATYRMAQRRAGFRAWRCPVRFWIMNGGLDVLPADIPVCLEGEGSFMVAGTQDPTVLHTIEFVSQGPPGGAIQGYAGRRIQFTLGGGSPGWVDDELMGLFLMVGPSVPSYAGRVAPIARNGADWIEVLSPGDFPSAPGGTHYVLVPTIELQQTHPVRFIIDQRNEARGYARGQQEMLDARVVLANFRLLFAQPT